MDMQELLNAISASSRATRGDYHITLGQLQEACQAHPDGMVFVDASGGLGDEHSYRGYYDDLAFSPTNDPTPAKLVLENVSKALSETYEGYKGGDFTYSDDTPLWCANWGCCGAAITDLSIIGDDIHLTTRVPND